MVNLRQFYVMVGFFLQVYYNLLFIQLVFLGGYGYYCKLVIFNVYYLYKENYYDDLSVVLLNIDFDRGNKIFEFSLYRKFFLEFYLV